MCRGISPFGTESGLSCSFRTCKRSECWKWEKGGGGRRGRGREGEGRTDLEVHTLALVRYDKERVHWALGSTSLVSITLAGQGIPLQSRLYHYIGQEVLARTTLDGDPCGLSPHTRCLDYNPWYLDQLGHVV